MILFGWMALEKSDLQNASLQGKLIFTSPQHILSSIHSIALYDKEEVGQRKTSKSGNRFSTGNVGTLLHGTKQ
jgi:hypothetical protein